jgi:hypothetical protein
MTAVPPGMRSETPCGRLGSRLLRPTAHAIRQGRLHGARKRDRITASRSIVMTARDGSQARQAPRRVRRPRAGSAARSFGHPRKRGDTARISVDITRCCRACLAGCPLARDPQPRPQARRECRQCELPSLLWPRPDTTRQAISFSLPRHPAQHRLWQVSVTGIATALSCCSPICSWPSPLRALFEPQSTSLAGSTGA